jgi:hypothetical protein
MSRLDADIAGSQWSERETSCATNRDSWRNYRTEDPCRTAAFTVLGIYTCSAKVHILEAPIAPLHALRFRLVGYGNEQ